MQKQLYKKLSWKTLLPAALTGVMFVTPLLGVQETAEAKRNGNGKAWGHSKQSNWRNRDRRGDRRWDRDDDNGRRRRVRRGWDRDDWNDRNRWRRDWSNDDRRRYRLRYRTRYRSDGTSYRQWFRQYY